MRKTFTLGFIALIMLLIPVESWSAHIAPFLTARPQETLDQSGMQPAEALSPSGIPDAAHPKLGPGIKNLIERSAALRKRGKRIPQSDAQHRIRVMLQMKEGAQLDKAGIVSRNGRILSERKNLIAAELPLDRIEEIVDADPQIESARLPHRFRPLGTVSQGVTLTSVPLYHEFGYRGQGVKIAVIDIGFKGMTDAQASGDLPQQIFSHDFTGRGLQTQYKHGTGCAEIVYDMAPEAELHLLKIGDEADLQPALDYCIANHIKVVSLSLGGFGSGPGNGTGPVDELCDEARANGILIVGGAGNAGNTQSEDGVPLGTHWEGLFSDGNYDNVHEFLGQNGNIILAMPKRDDDGNPEHDEVTIGMRWDDWQAVTTDYDMHLYHYDYQTKAVGGLAASSASPQNGAPGQRPYEEIEIDLPDAQEFQFYYLQVTRKAGSSVGKKLEIALGGNCAFVGPTAFAPPIATSSGSILEPADAASVFAVGAISHIYWNYGPQEDFSSQGPTNDWAGAAARIKPDICAPDGVATMTYGQQFPGTSAATPHVAGAAALLWSLRPNLLPGEVQSTLESWAQDLGDYGKDNLFGSGKLRLSSHTLSIHKNGLGTISIAPGGASCESYDSYCSPKIYPSGMNVTLTATPGYGSTFAGWSGVEGCSGTGPCTLTMDSSKYVSVQFDGIYYWLSISMAGTGIGAVTMTPPGYWCYWSSCSNSYYMGSPVTLTAEPRFDSTFTGWSGGGCGGRGACTVALHTDTTVTATFVTAAPIAFIPNFAYDTVSIINTSQALVVATVNVGDGPRSVTVNQDGTRVYTGNILSNDVSVIDTLSKTVVAAIPVGNAPHGVAVNPAGTRVYVANNGSNSVSVIDASDNTVVATVPVGNAPVGVAVNPAGTRVYVTNNGSNTVSVIDASHNTVIDAIPVGNAPVGVAVNPAGKRVYVTNNDSSNVSVIDASHNTVVATVTVGNAPHGVAVNPAGTRVYVANYDSDNVSVIETSSNTVIATVPVGSAPSGISVNPAGTRIYVTNYESNDISVIDTSNNEVILPNLTVWGPFAFGQFISAVALKGDLNDDGTVNLADAILAMQVMSDIHPSDIRTDYATSGADLNGNHQIGLDEVIFIMQILAVVR